MVLDLIRRIPAGQSILNSGNNGRQSRGFSGNDDRMLFLDGVAGGVLTSRELRERREGRVFNFSLRGTFQGSNSRPPLRPL